MQAMEKHPLAQKAAVVSGENWRFTVLTPALVRVEYDAEGLFNDAPTQTVLCREFPLCAFRAELDGQGVQIDTEQLHLTYAGGVFTAENLSITVKATGSSWHFGEKPAQTLGGTARTLDKADGACPVGHGLFSREGWEVLDDSNSLLLDETDFPQARRKGCVDQYIFCYGHDYLAGLRDYYHLTGETPMLPRFAMGNWWSRYYPYSEETYLALMDRFRQEQVPMSVAVIDMDWHLVKLDPKYGSGWTGYTWNPALFPDPPAFLQALHQRGMTTMLNLHPAMGIRAYEKAYPAIAKHMGVNIEAEEKVPFDAASPKFMHYYFEDVLHPMEEEGVDYWWVDWQQGTKSAVEGLDPLWVLNHQHFMDSARDGKRPMTFSRYAGPGSHRYPIGFSGDTVVTWASLAFQPYFTATADNIGYAWWSHDIGGHMYGYKDDELYGRWVQLGVFSPICRLHSSDNIFNNREPWNYRADVCNMAEDFLRLRHRLIPYLYTMNHRMWAEGKPLCQPMYYAYPETEKAYSMANEYIFGSELLCAPITRHTAADAPVASTPVWLPEGEWTDFFTGVRYRGGRQVEMYRNIASFPVLAKAGAIIPMTEDVMTAARENPKVMTLRVYAGASGQFTMYEDDNTTKAYQQGICALTKIVYEEGEKAALTIAVEGHTVLLPQKRAWNVELVHVPNQQVTCCADGEPIAVSTSYDAEKQMLCVVIPACAVEQKIVLTVNPHVEQPCEAALTYAHQLLVEAEMSIDEKERLYFALLKSPSRSSTMSELQRNATSNALLGALTELCNAYWDEKE